jgi:hypothetical protein
MRTCTKCGINKPEEAFSKNTHISDGLNRKCKECISKTARDRLHKLGVYNPYYANPTCSQYLGVHVAERVLVATFNKVDRAPLNTPGFDFVCGRGYKVDVKSACRQPQHESKNTRWSFNIRKNMVADYFICLAFDHRNTLVPEHVWIIPSDKVSHLTGLSIADSSASLKKWSGFEKPVDGVASACDHLRSQGGSG